LKAVSQALKDGVTVISISWGGPAILFPLSYLLAWERVATMGMAMKIPIIAASGDDGSSDGLPGVNVDAPACVPSIMAVGATALPGLDRSREVAWPSTGGGVGDMDAPARQKGLLIPHAVTGKIGGRVVPDGAINGDSKVSPYYLLIPNGAGWQWNAVGGTSAGPPAVSAMYANITEALQEHKPGERIGDLNALAYRLWAPNGGFQDIVAGSNGAYHSQPGFDAVTGHGSPNHEVDRELTLSQFGINTMRRNTHRAPSHSPLAAA
jgi:kumamolisin